MNYIQILNHNRVGIFNGNRVHGDQLSNYGIKNIDIEYFQNDLF